MGVLLLFDHISNYIYDYYFFLNGLDEPCTGNCAIFNIVYSICIGRHTCIPPFWPYMYRPHDIINWCQAIFAGFPGRLLNLFNICFEYKNLFSPILVKSPFLAFFPEVFKIALNALWRAYICKNFRGEDPRHRHLRALPYPPHALHCVASHRVALSCPTQKNWVKRRNLKIQISSWNTGSM